MMNRFNELMVLMRVLNSGVIMSIEKNERELKGLERDAINHFGYKHCLVFNSCHGALHGALVSKGYKYGDDIKLNKKCLGDEKTRFFMYLGLNVKGEDSLDEKLITRDIAMLAFADKYSSINVDTAIFDLSNLGYGPAALLLLNDEYSCSKADRLIIFGKQDMKTMWDGKESNPDLEPTIQFNYRLSPLVAALIRSKLFR